MGSQILYMDQVIVMIDYGDGLSIRPELESKHVKGAFGQFQLATGAVKKITPELSVMGHKLNQFLDGYFALWLEIVTSTG